MQEILTQLKLFGMGVTSYVNELTGGNHFAAAALFAGFAYMLRGMPVKIATYISRWTTRTYTVEWESTASQDYELACFIEARIVSGLKIIFERRMFIEKRKVHSAIPSGTNYFLSNGRLIRAKRTVTANLGSSRSTSSIAITCFFFDSGYINSIIEEFNKEKFGARVYSSSGWIIERWAVVGPLPENQFVTINTDLKEQIDNHIDGFVNNKDWYASVGKRRTLNMLFSGMPGTGKSTLAEYVAKRLKSSLFIYCESDVNGLFMYLAAALRMVPEGETPVILFDDIDANITGLNRNIDEPEQNRVTEDGQVIKRQSTNLGNILKMLQSSVSIPDIVIIINTNNKAALDEAIFRPGRIHLDLEVGFMDKAAILEFILKAYNFKYISSQTFEYIRACDVSDANNKHPHDVNAFMRDILAAAEVNKIKFPAAAVIKEEEMEAV